MTTILVLTNGTLSANLVYNSSTNPNYMLARDGWAPAVAGRRRSALGGGELFLPVVEEIDVYAMGASAAAALANVETLAILLDQAERWNNQEVLSTVRLQYRPTGGAATAESVVLGRAEGDETNGINLDVEFNRELNAYMIKLKLRILRRGYWCTTLDTDTVAAAANPAVLSLACSPAASIPVPVEIDLTGFTTAAATGNVQIPAGYIAIGPTGFASLQEGEAGAATLAAGATYTSTADATARASGGNVGRLNHNLTSVGERTFIAFTLPAGFLNSRRMRVLFTYRNNAAVVWNVYAIGTRGAYQTQTTVKQIAAGPNNPTVFVLDDLSSPYGLSTITIVLATVSGSGTPTIDIDTILAVDLTDPTAVVIAHNGATGNLGASFASANAQVSIQHDPLTLLTPQMRLDVPSVAGGQFPLDYGGDIALHQIGSGIDVVWYATHLYNGATPYWRTQNVSGAATLSIGASAIRRLATITPK